MTARPELLLSGVALVGVVGSSAYFGRRIGQLQTKLDEMNTHLTSTIKKVSDLPQKQHILELAKGIQADRTILDETQVWIQNLEAEVTSLNDRYDMIISALEDIGCEVKSTVKVETKRKPVRKVRFPQKKEDMEEISPTRPTKTGRVKRPVKEPEPEATDEDEDEIERAVSAAQSTR
jgi:hypothetical protein